jgi:hypothetical protein
MKEKKCKSCNKIKKISNFRIRTNKHGYHYETNCKECERIYDINRRHTLKGKIKSLYRSQVNHSKKRNMNKPNYSLVEFTNFLLKDDWFIQHYETWILSDYNNYFAPSIDRKNDYESYTLNNIQVLYWFENRNKSFNDRKNGVNNKSNKAVIRIDKITGEKKQFHSIQYAARQTNGYAANIHKALNKQIKSAYGYYWYYKKDV